THIPLAIGNRHAARSPVRDTLAASDGSGYGGPPAIRFPGFCEKSPLTLRGGSLICRSRKNWQSHSSFSTLTLERVPLSGGLHGSGNCSDECVSPGRAIPLLRRGNMTRKFLGLVAVVALFAIVVDSADARRCGGRRRCKDRSACC